MSAILELPTSAEHAPATIDVIWVESDVATPRSESFAGPLHVRSSIKSGSAINASSIRIDGDVDGCQLMAVAELVVTKRMSGSRDVRCYAGKSIHCDSASGLTLIAGGDIVANALQLTQICCGSKVIVEHGPIVGGTISANAGISCHTAGSADGTPTTLVPGSDVFFQMLFREQSQMIDRERARLRLLRDEIAASLNDRKHMSAEAKEQVTEKLCLADTQQHDVDRAIAKLRAAFQTSMQSARSEVHITGGLHKGVTFRFPEVVGRISTSMTGKFNIRPVHQGGEAKLLVEDLTQNRRTMLNAIHVETNLNQTYERWFASVAS